MSKKATMATSREVANQYIHILGSAAEDGVRGKVSSLPEAEQFGGMVIVIVSVPYRDENGDVSHSQAIVSNCTDTDVVHSAILQVALEGITKRQGQPASKEALQ